MRTPRPGRNDPREAAPRGMARWGAQAGAVLGGFLLLRFLQPAAGTGDGLDEAGDPQGQTQALGRGNPQTPPSRRARDSGHETRDLSGLKLSVLVAGLGVAVAGIIGLMVVMVNGFDHAQNAAAPAYSAQQTAAVKPPPPTLQSNPVEELGAFYQREDALIHHYAWLDGDHSHARIPIDRAMQLIVGHPLDTAP